MEIEERGKEAIQSTLTHDRARHATTFAAGPLFLRHLSKIAPPFEGNNPRHMACPSVKRFPPLGQELVPCQTHTCGANHADASRSLGKAHPAEAWHD
jgi:hypothetical protein